MKKRMAILNKLSGFFKEKENELGILVGTSEEVSKKRSFNINGQRVAVFNVNGQLYAIDAICSHKGGPLDEGELNGTIVTCPWHGAKFDVTTGKVVGPPAKDDKASYLVTVKDGQVYVKLTKEEKKGLTLKFTGKPDPEAPFGYKPFLDWLSGKLKFKTKLYGVLDMKMIYQDPLEIDLDMGEIHITEVDLKELSKIMDESKSNWNAGITYCLYHSTQFPGHMLINIRGPKAPKSLDMNIKFQV